MGKFICPAYLSYKRSLAGSFKNQCPVYLSI
nr:MAG TPA_asm: hypothetical protein [Caudoviricetes sp.]